MNKVAADMILLVITFVWGATFVVVQQAIEDLKPFGFNGIRFLIAVLFLVLWLSLFKRQLWKKFNIQLLKDGMLLGLFLFAGYALQTIGLLYTTSSKAGFITGLSVVLVPVFAYFIMKTKPSPQAILGVVMAAVGLFLLSGMSSVMMNKGDLFVLLCAMGFGLHIVFTAKVTANHSALLLTIVQIGTVAILSTGFSFIVEGPREMLSAVANPEGYVVFALLFTAVFATSLAYLGQTALQKKTAPTHVALIFVMEPVFAAATAFLWAGERLSSTGIVGCILILFGMLLAEIPLKFIQRIKSTSLKA
ncbi:DMT family transporter [Pseudalkalibacillus caeni]|uniref:DMT family transporter n=1 Tax=Exobacillus caeni TaxID=2574798 RepID=A0A5R9FHD1_9BACL|nr:DMT family transporter [Pseudalkalibacillus caeni]TLS38975.1 DMT family transporter [Pseudalkalibacillus caeni]